MRNSIVRKIIIVLALLVLASLIFVGCKGTENQGSDNAEEGKIVDASKYTLEIEDEKYLKDRISNATAVYYKCTAEGDFGLEEAVFERTVLPDEYLEVEYVQSNGRQFINTGVEYKSGLSLDLVFSDYTTDALMGSVVGTDGYLFTLSRTDTNQLAWLASKNLVFGYQYFSEFKKYTVHCESSRFVVNGTDAIPVPNPIETKESHNIWIFRGANGYASCKLYGMSVTDGKTKVADFIPCVRESDEVAGLYDIVRGKFFIAEAEVSAPRDVEYQNLPEEYKQVEYIEGLGDQYADTGLKISADMTGELNLRMQFLSTDMVWGAADFYFQYCYQYFNSMNVLDIHITYADLVENIYRDGEQVISTDFRGNPLAHTGVDSKFGIFRLGTINDDWFIYDEDYYGYTKEVVCQEARLYSMSVIIEEELRADYVPCVRLEDGCTGLYDKVSQSFLEVVGCKYGMEVDNPEEKGSIGNTYERLEYVYFSGSGGEFSTGTSGIARYAFDVQFDERPGQRMLMGYDCFCVDYWGVNANGNYESYFEWQYSNGSPIPVGGRDIIVDEYCDRFIQRYVNGTYALYFALDEDYMQKMNACNYWVGCLMYEDGPGFRCAMKLYGLTVEQGGEIVRNYVPGRRKSDDKVGFYESVGGEFIEMGNAEESFIAGKQVGHNFDEGEVLSERSESQIGDTLYTCKICGRQYHKIEDCLSYSATFAKDEGVESVIIYKGYDYSEFWEGDVAYARNKNTNNFSKFGGEVRFAIKLKDGYEIESVAVSGLEKVTLEQGVYVLSDIFGDMVVTITTKSK